MSFKTIGLNYEVLKGFISDNLLLALLRLCSALYRRRGTVVARRSDHDADWRTVVRLADRGAPVTVVAATIGATIIFLIAKSSFGEALAAKAGPWIGKLRKGFQENALSYLLFLRLVPAFPFVVVNLAPALLGVPLRTYVIGTLFGIIPGTTAYSMAGAGLGSVVEAQNKVLCGMRCRERRRQLRLHDRFQRPRHQRTRLCRRRARRCRAHSRRGQLVQEAGQRPCSSLIKLAAAASSRCRYRQPGETLEADLCVIGAGSGGLSVAAAAAAFGVRVVLIEKHKMGGDCLNYGCVPSKAMIAAGKHAHAMRSARAVRHHAGRARHRSCRRQRSRQARHRSDRAEQFRRALSPVSASRVIQAAGSFIDKYDGARRRAPHQGAPLRHRDRLIARRAADSRALIETPYFTNETLFDNRQQTGSSDYRRRRPDRHGDGAGASPARLQGHRARRSHAPWARTIPNSPAVVLDAVRREGVVIREGAMVESVSGTDGEVEVTIKIDGREETVSGSHILMAVGRKPNLDGLGLEQAGIEYERAGIKGRCGHGDHEPQGIRDRRLHRRPAVHPCRELSCRHRHPPGAVPHLPAKVDNGTDTLGDLHRA